jgi:hypothetical protein
MSLPCAELCISDAGRFHNARVRNRLAAANGPLAFCSAEGENRESNDKTEFGSDSTEARIQP